MKAQPWCNGKVGLWGVSYLGFTAYAAAGSEHGHHVDALMPVATSATTHSILYHNGDGGPFALELTMKWLWLAVKLMNSSWYQPVKFFVPFLHGEVNKPINSVPLCDQDQNLFGKRVDFYQQALQYHSSDHDFWKEFNTLCNLEKPKPPASHIVAGWYDFFLRQSFNDFTALIKNNDPNAQLTIYPVNHWGIVRVPIIKLCFDWFERHLKLQKLKAPVARIQVSVLGDKKTWLGFNTWPPKEVQYSKFFLGCGGRLELDAPKEVGSGTSHIYNPSNPTPNVGGPSFDYHNSGMKDQRKLERRSDVLIFTSKKLKERVYVAGNVFVKAVVSSSNPYTDFFFKLCDVNENGKSINICENIIRLRYDDWDKKDEKGAYRKELTLEVSFSFK